MTHTVCLHIFLLSSHHWCLSRQGTTESPIATEERTAGNFSTRLPKCDFFCPICVIVCVCGVVCVLGWCVCVWYMWYCVCVWCGVCVGVVCVCVVYVVWCVLGYDFPLFPSILRHIFKNVSSGGNS
jgi:hypothetical protein